MKSTVAQLGEFGLIEWIRQSLGKVPKGYVCIGDDTAVIPPLRSGEQSLETTDMLVEDVHFVQGTSPSLIGHKAVACSLSDIAAMGGKPRYMTVSLGLPPRMLVRDVKQLIRGMIKTAEQYGVVLVGGDTVKSAKIVISVAMTGTVKNGAWVSRAGARPGDTIFVTGPLGCSFPTGHHLRFTPRLKESQYVVRYCKPSAMMDLSDGLAGDLGHILAASRVGAVLDGRAIPLRETAVLSDALSDGEDFELLFTLPPRKAKWLQNRRAPYSFIAIGCITEAKEGLTVIQPSGQRTKIQSKGFTHFS